jgi:hypothetical protein
VAQSRDGPALPMSRCSTIEDYLAVERTVILWDAMDVWNLAFQNKTGLPCQQALSMSNWSIFVFS